MITIKFNPQGGHPATTTLEIIDDDSLLIDGEFWTFDPTLIHFPAQGPVQAGYRDSAGLHLTILFKIGPEGAPPRFSGIYVEGQGGIYHEEAFGPGVVQ